jgi:hypothetical protein
VQAAPAWVEAISFDPAKVSGKNGAKRFSHSPFPA